MSKHPKAGEPGTIQPPGDLKRNPGIGQSRGKTMSGLTPDIIEGETTVEGDVENDVRPSGLVDPNQRGRTNS